MAVPLPNQPTAQNLGNPGVWGEIACVAAIVEHYAALLPNPRDIEVHVLGPTTNDVLIYRAVRHLGHGNPAFTIHLLHLGYHYRALWPKNAVDGIHPSMLISKIAETAKIPQKNTTIFTSLKLVNGDAKSKTSTFDHASGAVLEIHHIDVGQGDSTLILIKDKDKAIRRSILIDTAEKTLDFSQQPVRRYLDSCIKTGNFRPIDVVILSHWDEDHMGAAAQLLSHGRNYFNTPLEIFDVGDSGMKDSDYQNYIDVINRLDKNDFRRRPPDPGEMILSCLGVEITCVARGEIGLNPQFDPTQLDSDLAEEFEDNLDALSYFNVGTDAFLPEEITSDDVVNLSAHDPGKKNNSSLAWTIVFGEFTYFTAGDLEHHAEANVIWGATYLLDRHVCAWKLSHHGSHHATRPGFLASARPRFGVASCGHANKHGHPGRAVIPRIQDLNKTYPCTVYVTGDVKNDPNNYGVPDNNCVFGNQGNVVISVTSTDAKTTTVTRSRSPRGAVPARSSAATGPRQRPTSANTRI